MSTSRHFNKICIITIVLSLILSIVMLNADSIGITASATVMGYENRLFDTEKVHTIDIVMNDWEEFIKTCENEEYSTCAVVIDGESFKNVGIRAKGNTSLSSVRSMGSQRYSFKLEFDHYESGKSYHGLDKLCLNNLIQDNTMMKDYITYLLMGDFGVDSPLCSFVYITVNGEEWGLYLAVEGVEDSFLSRNYGSDIGELYKPDSMSFGGGRGNGRDFNFDSFDFDIKDTDKTSQNKQDDKETENNKAFPKMPGGFNDGFGGDVPQMPDGFNSGFNEDMPQIPDGFNGSFGDDIPTIPDSFAMPDGNGSEQDNTVSDMTERPDNFGGRFIEGFGGFGMGSNDVKLKYIDDDPDSYQNIFNNAKTDISKADKSRLISSLKRLSEYSDLENVVDIDEVLRYFVVHIFVQNGDSYTGSMIHNYYLHEKDGQLSMIPWDYNLAFGTFQGESADSAVNQSIDNPISGDVNDRPMVGWIFSDESYTEAYHQLFSEFIQRWFANGELVYLIENTSRMIAPYVEKNPTRFCTYDEFETGVETLSEFVTLRAEAISRQLSGDDTAVDADGLNLSDMGSMGGSTGGFGGRGGSKNGEGNVNAPESEKSDSINSNDQKASDNINDIANQNTDGYTSGSKNPQQWDPPKSADSGSKFSGAKPDNTGNRQDFSNFGSSPWNNGSNNDGGFSVLVIASIAVLAAGIAIGLLIKH